MVDGLTAEQESAKLQLKARLRELDAQLSEISDASNSLVVALVFERAGITDAIVAVERRESALGVVQLPRIPLSPVTKYFNRSWIRQNSD